MSVFPQFATGAGAQYPVVKLRRTRTALEPARDGKAWRYGDAAAARIEWELELRGLNDNEAASLRQLFESCEGRLQPFLFLDPTDNLLGYSEDLTASAWQKDALISLTAGVADPKGGTAATLVSNTAQAAQAVKQTLGVPADFHYCLSVWVRAAQPGPVDLVINTASASARKTFTAGAEWARVRLSAKLGGVEQTVDFGIELQAGAAVQVFGFQVEAQPGCGEYKKTAAGGGVYPKARFAQDELALTAEAPGRFSARVRITSSVANGA